MINREGLSPRFCKSLSGDARGDAPADGAGTGASYTGSWRQEQHGAPHGQAAGRSGGLGHVRRAMDQKGAAPMATTWKPDPTFYPSPKTAMVAPQEELAYVAMLSPDGNGRPDALGVLDVDPRSSSYAQLIGRLAFPYAGHALPPLGWHA